MGTNNGFETKTANVFLYENKIVRVNIKSEARQSLSDAQENMQAAVNASLKSKRPLLTDIRMAQPLDPDARRYYSGQALVDHFTAIALLVDISPVGRMMANVYLKIAKPLIPSRMFTDEKAALSWLLEHV
jgi:hypothetical protein